MSVYIVLFVYDGTPSMPNLKHGDYLYTAYVAGSAPSVVTFSSLSGACAY